MKYTPLRSFAGTITFSDSVDRNLPEVFNHFGRIYAINEARKKSNSTIFVPEVFELKWLQIEAGPISDFLNDSLGMERGFFISKKFKDVLEKFSISPHVYFPAKLEYKGEVHDFFHLCLTHDFYDKFDEINEEKTDLIQMESESGWEFHKRKFKHWHKQNYLLPKKTFSEGELFDLFVIENPISKYYFSERIIAEMKKESIGFDEAPWALKIRNQ